MTIEDILENSVDNTAVELYKEYKQYPLMFAMFYHNLYTQLFGNPYNKRYFCGRTLFLCIYYTSFLFLQRFSYYLSYSDHQPLDSAVWSGTTPISIVVI